MKACYFIQTHKNPNQIYRLVRTIKKSSPTAQILIGHDSTSCHLDMAPLQDLPEVTLLKGNARAIRGDFSLLQPYFNAINWLFEHNSDFEWLVYISGQDYPTQSLSKVEDFLSKTDYDGFMKYFDAFSNQCLWDESEVLKRYFCQYYRLPGWTGRFLLRMWKIQEFTPIIFSVFYGSLIGLRAKITPFDKSFLCYGGYQWHTLSRKCVQYIKDFVNQNPEIISYYQKTLVPDESLVQTILINSNFFKICNNNKRYVDFTGTDSGHARILANKDYETITNGSFHFARKFDQNADILDMLDAEIFQDLA